ncbi:MAG: enoyl-CoA hydratase [Gemmatimonadales bacterium]
MSIKTDLSRGVLTVEIARPEKKNALTVAMYHAIADAFIRANTDPAIRAVLVTGQPGIFCSGNDVEDFLHRPAERWTTPIPPFMTALLDCEKPVIAAVTGPAVGVGVTMLLHCDLVYLAEGARLTMPFVALGVVPEFASSLVVPRLMGRVRAAERLLLGTPLSAAEAVEFGVANAVLPAADLLPHARSVAERFNDLPPGAVRDTKKLLMAANRAAIEEAILREMAVLGPRIQSAEAKEAFTAFLEKRRPDFSRF